MTFFLNSTYAGLGFIKSFIPKTHPNCARSALPSNANFCSSFKAATQCSCSATPMAGSTCNDMGNIHQKMLSVFDTQLSVCQFQQDVSAQMCMDSWNCYLHGGKDSRGRLCQTTGAACETLR